MHRKQRPQAIATSPRTFLTPITPVTLTEHSNYRQDPTVNAIISRPCSTRSRSEHMNARAATDYDHRLSSSSTTTTIQGDHSFSTWIRNKSAGMQPVVAWESMDLQRTLVLPPMILHMPSLRKENVAQQQQDHLEHTSPDAEKVGSESTTCPATIVENAQVQLPKQEQSPSVAVHTERVQEFPNHPIPAVSATLDRLARDMDVSHVVSIYRKNNRALAKQALEQATREKRHMADRQRSAKSSHSSSARTRPSTTTLSARSRPWTAATDVSARVQTRMDPRVMEMVLRNKTPPADCNPRRLQASRQTYRSKQYVLDEGAQTERKQRRASEHRQKQAQFRTRLLELQANILSVQVQRRMPLSKHSSIMDKLNEMLEQTKLDGSEEEGDPFRTVEGA